MLQHTTSTAQELALAAGLLLLHSASAAVTGGDAAEGAEEHRHHAVHASAISLHSSGEPCSRSRSRLVRAIIASQLSRLGGVGGGGGVNPADARGCPFHPAADMFAAQEQQKHKQPRRRWKCGFCSKVFVSEAYLDRHMGRRHADAVPKNATACLADFCDVFGCGADGGGGGAGAVRAVAGCVTGAHTVDRLRFSCKAAMLRCFPPARGAVWLRAHVAADARWCEPLRCGLDDGGGPAGAVESRSNGDRGAAQGAVAVAAAAAAAAKSAEAVSVAATGGAGEWEKVLVWSTSWLGWLGAAATVVYYWVLGVYARGAHMRPDLRPGLLVELMKRRR